MNKISKDLLQKHSVSIIDARFAYDNGETFKDFVESKNGNFENIILLMLLCGVSLKDLSENSEQQQIDRINSKFKDFVSSYFTEKRSLAK